MEVALGSEEVVALAVEVEVRVAPHETMDSPVEVAIAVSGVVVRAATGE